MNIDKALEKIKNWKENKNFENYIKEKQKENLSFAEYRNLVGFLDSYNTRDYLDLENQIRIIIDDFCENLNRLPFNYCLDEFCVVALFKLQEIAKLITYEHESSNEYLDMFMTLMVETSKSVGKLCGIIGMFCCEPIPETHHFDYPSGFNNFLPIEVEEQFIDDYAAEKFGCSSIDKVDEEHIYVYKNYNEYVKSIHRMANAILYLQTQVLLYHKDLNIFRISLKCSANNELVRVSLVKRDKTPKDNRIYMLNEKTIQNIGRVFGMSFDSIATMEPASFEEYTNNLLEAWKNHSSFIEPQLEPESTEEHTHAAQLVLTNNHNSANNSNN